MEWLDDNKVAVEAQVAADRVQRAGVDLSPYVTNTGLGISVILTVIAITITWLALFTYYNRRVTHS
jgi:uncharacterized membrane protein